MIRMVLISILFIPLTLFSQNQFYNKGRILYERKTNAYRLSEGSWMNQFYAKKKFTTDTFSLDFDSTRSLYKNPNYDEENEESDAWFHFSLAPDISNTVYKSLNSDTVTAIRQLFESRLYITDSIRRPNWKLTGETREIAGFTCYKAVAVLYDSLYVVAFYTDEILPQSGPETFGRLPGMIMGLAIPRLYTTWMAIKFDPEPQPISKPKISKKKKENFNWNTFYINGKERFNDWGEPYKTLLVWMWGV